MAELQTLRSLRRQHKDEPLAALTIEAAILGVQADLKLIEIADANASRPLLAATSADRQAKPAEGRRVAGQ
jgi:hypothetical protein